MEYFTNIEVAPGWDILIPKEEVNYTPEEPFTVKPPDVGHVYDAACEFALSKLGAGEGKRCLVVGSPPFEVHALEDVGWSTTLIDIRQPPDQTLNWVQGDASQLPFQDNAFDALSSTCCYCHVGLGRYQDPRYPDGDVRGLIEAFRVLKPGAQAAIMLGPSIPTADKKSWVMGVVHRIYSLSGALERVQKARFNVLDVGFWESDKKAWMSLTETEDHYADFKLGDSLPYCYLCFHVEKPKK